MSVCERELLGGGGKKADVTEVGPVAPVVTTLRTPAAALLPGS
jgi:hypothetical protein